MKKIKVKKQDKNIQAGKPSRQMIIILAAAVILVIVLILAENIGSRKVVVSNETDLNLEYVQVYFTNETTESATEDIFYNAVNAGDSQRASYESLDLRNTSSEIIVAFKFEGYDEILIYDGEVNTVINGKINLKFYKKDGDYLAYFKAGAGLFGSTDATGIDTEFLIDLDGADWDYNY